MARPEIVQYVKSYREQGYALPQIRQALHSGGISDREIDEALVELGASRKLPALVYIIGGLGIAILLVALLYAYVASSPSQVPSLSIRLSPLSRDVVPGEQVSLVREVSRTGPGFAEVRISYTISGNGVQVVSSEEVLRVVTRESGVAALRLAKDAPPGQYVLLAQAKAGAQSSKASFTLTVKGEAPLAPGATVCPRSCDDFNPCTIDVCQEGDCAHHSISPCCGNGVCESGEQGGACEIDCRPVRFGQQEGPLLIKEQAITVARRSSQDGVALCRSLPRESDQDECLESVAKASSQSGVCLQVAAKKDRDSCLMDFVVQKDEFHLCDEIRDVWLKNSCVSYQRLKNV
ncbi:hypothetical protein HY641_02465 [Candidatus Woesearchaeota archaeon]|nr:hypothetical protein [Candidatus Woesearchaeota archaeon]